MAIRVTCGCGASYGLRDELAGTDVLCPQCGAQLHVAAAGPFERDKFLLRQTFLAISEKYYVWDEQGRVLLYIERPAHFWRNFSAILAGVAAAIVAGLLIGIAIGRLSEAAGVIAGILAGVTALVAVATALSKKRHVTFYRDDTKQQPLLEILQDKKFMPINATYTVNDATGATIARLRKNHLYNFFRKRWYCCGADGAVLCVAKEDSIMLSLLRRLFGPLFGALRTNFIILEGTGDDLIGEFNRKFTILDRYVLDMSADAQGRLDRRVALALGVMLDTGERR